MNRPRCYVEVQMSGDYAQWYRYGWYGGVSVAVDTVRRLITAKDSSGNTVFKGVRIRYLNRTLDRFRVY